ncbi:MAG: ethylbenzene dehydrogenase-related protein [Haloferacaceae archaeon]
MPSERQFGALAAVAALLLVATAVGPAVVGGRPAYEIPVREVDDGTQFTDPTAETWLNVSSVEVPLESAPSSAPNASNVTVDSLHVRAVRTDGELYLRLSWPDSSENRTASAPRQFADKVAVEMPVNTSARPPIAMGSTSNAVNVWVWDGAAGTQELLAGGPGTTTRFPNATVRANATYRDGRWAVVFHRDLRVDGANRTDVQFESDLNVAFAVWNGGNMERAGRKSVSEWYYLPFAPEAGGPPYETLLWAVAGLAILVVVAVTVEGVRRAREEGE